MLTADCDIYLFDATTFIVDYVCSKKRLHPPWTRHMVFIVDVPPFNACSREPMGTVEVGATTLLSRRPPLKRRTPCIFFEWKHSKVVEKGPNASTRKLLKRVRVQVLWQRILQSYDAQSSDRPQNPGPCITMLKRLQKKTSRKWWQSLQREQLMIPTSRFGFLFCWVFEMRSTTVSLYTPGAKTGIISISERTACLLVLSKLYFSNQLTTPFQSLSNKLFWCSKDETECK